MNRWKKYGLRLLVLATAIGVWESIVLVFNVSPLLLPRPGSVFSTYITAITTGPLLNHTLVTLSEAMSGFVIGATAAVFLGYFLAKSRLAENALLPYVVAAQAMPMLALAPLILIWFGFGMASKVVITALIVFFPMFINTFVATKSVSPALKELMQLIHASKWQVFKDLEVPSSLPFLFAGFKTSVTLSVIGAVVGEFIGATGGLGFLIMFSTGNLNTTMVFVALIQLAILGFLLYKTVEKIGARLMRWHESEQSLHLGI